MKGIRRFLFPFISLGLFALIGCYWGESPVDQDGGRPKTPDFILKDLEGQEFQLSDLQGEVVMMQFFADWCAICQTETAVLNKLNSDLQDTGLVIVGIAVVESGDREAVQDFADRYKVNYRILLDEVVLPLEGLTVADAYGVGSVPVTVIIDREGWIDERKYTGFLSEEDLIAVIEPLL